MIHLTPEQFDNWTKHLEQTKNISAGQQKVVSSERRQKVVSLYKKHDGRKKPIARELHMGSSTVLRILQEEGLS